MIRARNLVLLALLSLSACSGESQPANAGVEARNVWVRLPPVAGRPGAAYFTLRNGGPAAVLAGVESPHAKRIELHDSQMHGGMMHMAPLAELALAQGKTVEFRPGGKHAMLFGVDPQLKAGDTMALSFSLRDGRKVEAQARLVTAGAPSPYAP